MMKVSHPIVFGHCVKVFYKELFEKYAEQAPGYELALAQTKESVLLCDALKKHLAE